MPRGRSRRIIKESNNFFHRLERKLELSVGVIDSFASKPNQICRFNCTFSFQVREAFLEEAVL